MTLGPELRHLQQDPATVPDSRTIFGSSSFGCHHDNGILVTINLVFAQ